MRKCPKCSLIHDDSVMKCTFCGYDFTEEDAIINEPVAEPVSESVVEPAVEVPVDPVTTEPVPQPATVVPPVQNGGYNPYGAPQVKYCPRCGNQCDPKAVICVKCGMPFENFNQVVEDDNPVTLLKVLSCLFPIAALILYLVYKDKKPKSAKEYGKWGLIGIAISVGFEIISLIINLVFGFGDAYYNDYDYYYTIFTNLFTMLK